MYTKGDGSRDNTNKKIAEGPRRVGQGGTRRVAKEGPGVRARRDQERGKGGTRSAGKEGLGGWANEGPGGWTNEGPVVLPRLG